MAGNTSLYIDDCRSQSANSNQIATHLRMNIEPNNEYLEDDRPFQSGDLQIPALLIFQGATPKQNGEPFW